MVMFVKLSYSYTQFLVVFGLSFSFGCAVSWLVNYEDGTRQNYSVIMGTFLFMLFHRNSNSMEISFGMWYRYNALYKPRQLRCRGMYETL